MPSAGSQMQQLPIVPSFPSSAPRVEVPPSAPKLAQPEQATVFVVQQLNVSGASVYTQTELLKVAEFEPGRAMSLQALYAMADKITQHYRRGGFPVARAYLPAQEFRDGTVTMTVLEGQYGQVALNNTSTRTCPQALGESEVGSRFLVRI